MMCCSRALSIAVLTAIVTAGGIPTRAVAQQQPALEVGARVRVTQWGATRCRGIGNVSAISGDTAAVRLLPSTDARVRREACRSEASLLVPAERLQLSRGFERRVAERTGKGFIWGLGTGVAIGFLAGAPDEGLHNPFDGWAVPYMIMGGTFGMLIGTATGLAIGVTVPVEVWEPVRRVGSR